MTTRTRAVRRMDRPGVHKVISQITLFSDEEQDIASELVDASLDEPDSGYRTLVTETDGTISGFLVFGDVPLAHDVYEIYWIAVDSQFRRQGIGRLLMEECVRAVRRRNARLLLLETSKHERYAGTRTFYRAVGLRVESRIRDYYRPGDDLVVFGKRLR